MPVKREEEAAVLNWQVESSKERPTKRRRTKTESKSVLVKKEERKPRLKREDKEIQLDEKSINDRLNEIDAKHVKISLDPAIVELPISRKYFSKRYGGSGVNIFPPMSKKKVEMHGMDSPCFLTLSWNPYAPQKPGHPGLAFCSAPTPYKGPIPVFVRLKPTARWKKRRAQWRYVGEYNMRDSEALTVAEWTSQTEIFQNTWITKGYFDLEWGKWARARLVLWEELGREPNDDEIEDALTAGREQEATRETVEDALSTGREKISVSTLECVSYWGEFQLELLEGFDLGAENWEYIPKGSCRKRKREDDLDENKVKADMDESDMDVKRRPVRQCTLRRRS